MRLKSQKVWMQLNKSDWTLIPLGRTVNFKNHCSPPLQQVTFSLSVLRSLLETVFNQRTQHRGNQATKYC